MDLKKDKWLWILLLILFSFCSRAIINNIFNLFPFCVLFFLFFFVYDIPLKRDNQNILIFLIIGVIVIFSLFFAINDKFKLTIILLYFILEIGFISILIWQFGDGYFKEKEYFVFFISIYLLPLVLLLKDAIKDFIVEKITLKELLTTGSSEVKIMSGHLYGITIYIILMAILFFVILILKKK